MIRGFPVAIAILCCACGGNPAGPDVPVRVIGYGSYFASAPGVTVIRDNAQWQTFVVQSGLRPSSFRVDDPLPPVNFPNEMAVALFLGSRPSTGYNIRVDRVARERNALVIHATEETPCVGATVITYPLTAIAVPETSSAPEVVWSITRQPGCS